MVTVLLLTWIKILPHSQIVLDGKIFIVDIPKMDYFLFLFFRIVTIKGHLCRLAKHNHQVEHDEEVKRILHWHFDNSLYTFKEVSFFRNTFYESVKKLLMTSYRFCLMIVYLFLSKSISCSTTSTLKNSKMTFCFNGFIHFYYIAIV